ncbi:MAG TPA: GGDEF domain-containing protein [Candidatus Binatia bacterium]|nr:GGDEF domain-containing protein [Candidatus Binatia bacterium]
MSMSAAAGQPSITLVDGSNPGEGTFDRIEVLSDTTLELARSATEAEVVAAVHGAVSTLLPGSPVRLALAAPGGWHLLLNEETQDEAILRLPLRVGGSLLGELSVLGAAPLPASQASTVAEIAAHTALALARLEYGRLLSGVNPADDLDVFAANSFRDPLTNLPSRMLYHDRVEHALHRRSRHVHPVAVMIIDLAGSITAVKEGMGHPAGDRLMVQVAKRLQRLVRSADTLARFRDDQLGVLLEELDSVEDAALVAERLLEALEEPFVLEAGLPLSMQTHVGIAVNSGAAESAVELLQKAATAADSARRRGLGYDTNPGRPRIGVIPRRIRR